MTMSLKKKSFIAAAALLAAGCLTVDGKIPCVNDTQCPADYPVCQNGKCVGGTPTNTMTVAIIGVDGKAAGASLSGTVTVKATAVAKAGVNSVTLSAGGASFNPTGIVAPVYSFNVDTTKLADGPIVLTATVVAGDGSTKTSDPFTINVDNTPPNLTATVIGSPEVADGTLVKLDVTSNEPLSTVTGTVSGSNVALAQIGPPTGLTYHFGYAVTAADSAGIHSVSFTAADPAGNSTSQTLSGAFNVHHPFSFGPLTISTGHTVNEQVGGLPAATLGTIVNASVVLPSTAGTVQPTFTLTTSGGATRALAAPTLTSGALNNTWSTNYTVISGDNDGIARVSATVTDAAGNTPTPATASFAVDETAPLAPCFTASPTNVDTSTAPAHNSVTVTANANKRLQSATISSSNLDTGICTCDGGACNALTSATPLVSCTITVTHGASTTPISATATLSLMDTLGNTTPVTSAYQVPYTIVPLPVAGGLSPGAGTITVGASTTLTPTFSNGAGIVTGSDASSFVVNSGTAFTVAPATTTSYTLTVTNLAGTSQTRSATVTIAAAPTLVSGTFTVTPSSITLGDSGNVRFAVPNFATANGALSASGNVTITGSTSNPGGLNPTIIVANNGTSDFPNSNFASAGTYTFTVTGSNQATAPATLAKSVTLIVFDAPAVSTGTLSVAPPKITQGETGNLVFTAPTFNAATTSAFLSTNPSATSGMAIASGSNTAIAKPMTAPGTDPTYFLFLTNTAGKIVQLQQVTVNIVAAPNTSGNLTSDTMALTVGDTGPITLTSPTFGTANGAFSAPLVLTGSPSSGSATISNGGQNNTYVKRGDFTVAGSYTYTVTASNTATMPATLPKSVSITAFDLPTLATNQAGQLSVSPTAIVTGESGNLTFTAPTFSTSVTSAFISTDPNPATASGTSITSGAPALVPKPGGATGTTVTYYLQIRNGAGKTVQPPGQQVALQITDTPSFTGNFTVSPTTLKLGDTTMQVSFTLPTTFTNISSAKVTGGGATITGGVVAGGTVNLPLASNPQATTTYTLTGTNAVGTAVTRTATLLVAEAIGVGAMSGARYGAAAVKLPSGKVLIAGGSSTSDGTNPLPTAVVFDPGAGTYGAVISFATGEARYRPTAVLLIGGANSGKVLVSGGSSSLSSAHDLFDPTGNGGLGTFTLSPAMASRRCGGHAALEFQPGFVVLAGGNDCAATPVDLATAEIWDGSGVDTPTSVNLTTARRGLTATLLPNGKVLFAGGSTSSGTADLMATTGSTKSMFAANATFTSVAFSGTTKRQFHTATPIGNGSKVLIAGGDAAATTDTAEIYDQGISGNGSFSLTANEMAAGKARVRHAAVNLSSGMLFLIGGTISVTGALNTTEFFDPVTNRFSTGPTLGTARDQLIAVATNNDLTIVAGGVDAVSSASPTDVIIAP